MVIYKLLSRLRIIFLHLLMDNGVRAWQVQTATPQGRMPMELALDKDEYYQLAKFIAEARKKYNNIIRIYEADCVGYYSVLSNDLYCKKWRGCQAGLQIIGVESNGDIKGCLSLHGDEFIEGNIRKTPFKEIWNSKDSFKLNRRFTKDKLQGMCRDCKWGVVCRGGCSEKALSHTGNPYESPYCLYKYEQEHGIC